MTAALVRPAAKSDAETIAAMVRKLAAHIQDASLTRTTADTLRAHGFGDDPSFSAVVAERDGDPLGYCLFTRTYSTWRAAPGVFVVDLFIERDARGLGVGRQLLRAAARWGDERGCAFMKLDVDPANHRARAFYERLGFVDDHDRAMVIERERYVAFDGR